MRTLLLGENSMLQLLRLLQDGQFHSGEALGAELGVSRAAVWKQLQSLEAERGLRFHKVRGRGYRLEMPLVLLDEASLAAGCQHWPISVVEVVDSTNAEVLRRLQAGQSAPMVVTAEQQTAGRGRRGRQWVSPFGQNLYYSLAIRIEGGLRQLEGLSLVVGLALAKALQQMGVQQTALKWPNDVLVEGAKIAGILVEIAGDPADACDVVIGIGVNVNMPDEAEGIDQAWTSVSAQLGCLVDRNALALKLGGNLAHYLEQYLQQGFSSLLDEWQDNHAWQGRSVRLSAGDRHVDGRVLGVNASGALRLEVDGVEQQFSGGELSLRLRDDS